MVLTVALGKLKHSTCTVTVECSNMPTHVVLSDACKCMRKMHSYGKAHNVNINYFSVAVEHVDRAGVFQMTRFYRTEAVDGSVPTELEI